MIAKACNILKSNTVAGYFWLLAGSLIIMPAVFREGNETSIAIGAVFLTLGIVFLSRDKKA